MSWAVGYDEKWKRDVGYGVPSRCDHPACNEEINRGLSYVCGGQPYGGENGCGLYFCGQHLALNEYGGTALVLVCERCEAELQPFTAKPDVPEWLRHKLTDASWAPWRKENPDEVAAIQAQLKENQ
jgi:hypothetical protein